MMSPLSAKGRRTALVALASLSAASPAIAQDIARAPAVQISGDSVEINFQNAEIAVVLTALAELSGLSLMHSILPDTRVTLRTGHPIDRSEAEGYLESLAAANDLQLEREGNLVRVAAPPREKRRSDAAQSGPTAAAPRLFVYRLHHAQATQIAGTLNSVFGGGGMVASTGLSRRGLSDELRQQRMGAPSGDGAGERPPGAADGLPGALEGSVRIVPDPPTNALLIHATPVDYAVVEAAIEKLDTRPLQVLIEVLIAEVRHDRTHALGVGAEVSDDRGPATVEGSLVGLSTGDVALRVLHQGGLGVDAILRAIAQTSDVSIVMRPVVLAQNNEEARILVGTQQPFVQLSRSLPTDDAVRDQVIQYKDVGTQLTIRPTINQDGYVSLTVLQEVSTATNQVQFDAPVIGTREAATRLLVKDGHTAILGGLVEQGKEWTRTGIPILKDIPLLGGLFGTTRSTDTATELVLFLTPHVLRDDEALEAVTDRARAASPGVDRVLPDTLPLYQVSPRPADSEE